MYSAQKTDDRGGGRHTAMQVHKQVPQEPQEGPESSKAWDK